MLSGKKILVTAGGTQEFIDDVRVITNISSGRLGAMITEELASDGAEVYHVCGKTSVHPKVEPYYFTGPFSAKIQIPPRTFIVRTAGDAMSIMERLVKDEGVDAVVHSMAVSDFTFKRDGAVKLRSSDPEAFIEFLRQNITMNPKIIGHIKEWRPQTVLIGFKFEVGFSHDDLIRLARESITRNGCDLVVANDKAEMKKEQEHVAVFVPADKRVTSYFKEHYVIKGKDAIAREIRIFLEDALERG